MATDNLWRSDATLQILLQLSSVPSARNLDNYDGLVGIPTHELDRLVPLWHEPYAAQSRP